MSKSICDWHQCQMVAINTVRRDVPRGESFTSLVWRRCGDHTPEDAGVHVSPLGTGLGSVS